MDSLTPIIDGIIDLGLYVLAQTSCDSSSDKIVLPAPQTSLRALFTRRC